MNGCIAYRGPSLLTNQPIVLVVTGLRHGSQNVKTGPMIQTWILRDTVRSPLQHVLGGGDEAICGDCKFRSGRGCYVQVGQGPAAIHRALRAGRYPSLPLPEIVALIASRAVRLGSYGDPAAVPPGILRALVSRSAKHTGYTHQWLRRPDLADLCMASVDSEDERKLAQALGFRTFRVMPRKGWSLTQGEILCPASSEAGHLTTCEKCGLCSGAGDAKNIAIPAHGATAKRATLQVEAA